MPDHETTDSHFFYEGTLKDAEKEYDFFRAVIAQLLDDETMVGDIDQRWIVFKDSWVYGMASYLTKKEAIDFGRVMMRDEISPSFIVVKVDVEGHGINAMEVLASAMTDGPGIDLSTTPDEINRKPGMESGR